MGIFFYSLMMVMAAWPAKASAAGFEALSLDAARSFQAAVGSAVADMRPKDLFAEVEACRIVDVKSLLPFSLKDAEKMLQPCARALSGRVRSSVEIKAGYLGVSSSEDGPRKGLQLRLGGRVTVSSAFMRDLQHALDRRGGSLLGHPVKVVREGMMRAMVQSSIQEAVDSCILPMVLRTMRDSSDFIRTYGGCLSRDSGLKIKGLSPAARHERAVAVLSAADGVVLASMNGWVTVPGAEGQVSFEVEASGTR